MKLLIESERNGMMLKVLLHARAKLKLEEDFMEEGKEDEWDNNEWILSETVSGRGRERVRERES